MLRKDARTVDVVVRVLCGLQHPAKPWWQEDPHSAPDLRHRHVRTLYEAQLVGVPVSQNKVNSVRVTTFQLHHLYRKEGNTTKEETRERRWTKGRKEGSKRKDGRKANGSGSGGCGYGGGGGEDDG